MSGGRPEYTDTYANTSYASYGGVLYYADAKYKDVYIASPDYESNNYINAASKKGDALYETSSGYGVGSWYGDNSRITYQNVPFFNRGGSNSGTTGSGTFNFVAYTYDVGSYGFRPAIIVAGGP